MEHVIGGKFKLGRKIGSGSFGELYLGTVLMVFLDLSCISVRSCCQALYLVSLFLFTRVINLVAGVNIQSGEEVAIKLVCDEKNRFYYKPFHLLICTCIFFIWC